MWRKETSLILWGMKEYLSGNIFEPLKASLMDSRQWAYYVRKLLRPKELIFIAC